MQIIPAVDIKDRKCVRLTRGDFSDEEIFSDDPLEMAKRWEREGAKCLHIVDLDGARTGEPKNFQIIKKIIKELRIPVQVGGGIRTKSVMEEIINLGAKVVIGTGIIENKFSFENRKNIIIALDAYEGKIVIRGWKEKTNISVFEYAKKVDGFGAYAILFTCVERDGMLKGPDINGIKKMVKSVKTPVIASGGVSSLDDIRKIKEAGAYGVIIGKALYKGLINLKEAQKI